MKVTYLQSAAILIEDEERSVLCDPWLLDGAYYGSWCHYPPPNYEPEDFHDVDYIYLSHVHPDHFHPESMRRLDTDTPVLIHDYRWDYLSEAIEELGFEVIELPHGEPLDLGGDWHINVFAADGCDPEACGNFFGCTWYDDQAETPGSTQVDSMAVLENGEHTLVNTNDCPFEMALPTFERITATYDDVDVLCHQYSAAQFYPQAMIDYSHEEKVEASREVILEKHELAERFVDLFEPEYYMPFAGEYVLAGSLAHLNEYTANPPREQAYDYFTSNIDPDDHQCVFLNSGEYLDVAEDRLSQQFQPPDPEKKEAYIRDVLAEREFAYESDPMPELSDLKSAVPEAYDSLEDKRETIGFQSPTRVLIPLVDDVTLVVSLDGDGVEYRSDREIDLDEYERYVKMVLDPRLLARIFAGPHEAYWADAKIGSHIGIAKDPDIYERGLYNCMSAFHT